MKFGITQTFDCSYLPEEQEQLLVCMLPSAELEEHYGTLMQNGFRRSGEQLYRPHCVNCNACESLRVIAHQFTASKQQKRVLKKNADLTISLRDDERDDYYPLYERYINELHADGSMFPATFDQYAGFLRSSWHRPKFIEARLDGELYAVAVTDVVSSGLSALYTFYAPEQASRSLGVFMVLQQIQLAVEFSKPYVYLGYQVDECRKMNYKQKFRPHQRFVNNQWQIHR